jgi:hypothetical protein
MFCTQIGYPAQSKAIPKAYTFKESIKYKKATSANIKHCNTGVSRRVFFKGLLLTPVLQCLILALVAFLYLIDSLNVYALIILVTIAMDMLHS